VEIWSAANGQRQALREGKGEGARGFARLARDCDEFAVVSNEGHSLDLIQTSDGTTILDSAARSDPTSIAFSASSNLVASFMRNGHICVSDAHTGKLLKTLRGGHINALQPQAILPFNIGSVVFLNDDATLLSAGGDVVRWAWEAGDRAVLLNAMQSNFGGLCLAVTPDQKLVAIGGEAVEKGKLAARGIRFWDREEKSLDSPFGDAGTALSVEFSRDGKQLVVGGADGAVQLWDVGARRQTGSFRGHRKPVVGVAMTPKGTFVASVGRRGATILWNAKTQQEVRKISSSGSCSVALSPDGKVLVAGGEDGSIIVSTSQGIKKVEGHVSEVQALAFSRDGKLFASGSTDGTIVVWDVSLVIDR